MSIRGRYREHFCQTGGITSGLHVHSIRSGRESLFEFDPEPMQEVKKYLDLVSEQWDQALSRLKSFAEG